MGTNAQESKNIQFAEQMCGFRGFTRGYDDSIVLITAAEERETGDRT